MNIPNPVPRTQSEITHDILNEWDNLSKLMNTHICSNECRELWTILTKYSKIAQLPEIVMTFSMYIFSKSLVDSLVEAQDTPINVHKQNWAGMVAIADRLAELMKESQS